MGVVGAEVDAVTDSLIEKVVSIEKRADELVERARAQVKEIQEETARRLKELQERYRNELDHTRQQLRADGEASLKQTLQDEERRFSQLQTQITSRAEPEVEAAGEQVVERFFQVGGTGPGSEGRDGH